MKLRAKVNYDRLVEVWVVTLWTCDAGGSRFFGHTSATTWSEALAFALWRVGLSGARSHG